MLWLCPSPHSYQCQLEGFGMRGWCFLIAGLLWAGPTLAQTVPQCASSFAEALGGARAAVCRCDTVPPFAEVYGSQVYAPSSNPCRSARHAGVLVQTPADIAFVARATSAITVRAEERNGVPSRLQNGVNSLITVLGTTWEAADYVRRQLAMDQFAERTAAATIGGHQTSAAPVAAPSYALIRTDRPDRMNSNLPPPNLEHFRPPVLPPPLSSPLLGTRAVDVPGGGTQPAAAPAVAASPVPSPPVAASPVATAQVAPAPTAPAQTAPAQTAPAQTAPAAVTPDQTAAAPAAPATAAAPPAPPALAALPPTLSGQARVQDTGRLIIGTVSVTLSGIQGVGGAAAQGMAQYLAAQGNEVTCDLAPDAVSYVCRVRNGQDLAVVALFNGAARTTPTAPDAYRTHEATARQARRGIWASAQ
ncbi:MAG: hypothetical protein EAZ99_08540 [Alphaproteobacteria bacterium]|nr:MAG: hypothetical protein EAZ99_08540 [Alphaproteobacteria bacterium]